MTDSGNTPTTPAAPPSVPLKRRSSVLRAQGLVDAFLAETASRPPTYPGGWYELSYQDWIQLSRVHSDQPVLTIGTIRSHLKYLVETGQLEQMQLNPEPTVRTFSYRTRTP